MSDFASRSSQYYLDNYLLVNLTFLVLAPFHVVVMILVAYRSYVLSIREKKPLKLSQRVPLYMVAEEFGMLVSALVPSAYQVSMRRNVDHQTCAMIGGIFYFFAASEFCLSVMLSAFTYMNVCRQINVSLGKYDWKLVGISKAITLVLLAIGIQTEWFGPLGEFFCFMDTTRGRHSTTIAIIGVLAISLAVLLVAAFKIPVLRKLRSTRRALSRVMSIKVDHGKLVFAREVDHAVLKISLYILIFTTKWLLGVPLYILLLRDGNAQVPVVFYAIPFVFFHVGGMINGIVYLFCEDFLPSFIARPLARRRAQREMAACAAAGWEIGDVLGVQTALEERRDEFVTMTVPVWNDARHAKGICRAGTRARPSNGRVMPNPGRVMESGQDCLDKSVDLKTMLFEERDEKIDLITMLAGSRQPLQEWQGDLPLDGDRTVVAEDELASLARHFSASDI